MKQFGTTETYDPCYVFDWDDKLLDANIIITKELSDDMIHKLLGNSDKIILHHTVTGQGGTWLEPGVKGRAEEFAQFEKLIKLGFPLSHYVLRLDPLIPIDKDCINNIQSVLYAWNKYAGFVGHTIRCRISMIDMYNHVLVRFNKANKIVPWEGFHAPDKVFKFVEQLLIRYPNLEYESCAENKFDLSLVTPVGCASSKDILALGQWPGDYNYPAQAQRKECLCLAKKQILGVKPGRCPHKCLYCYWKD
jgi:DNA repair photolyase